VILQLKSTKLGAFQSNQHRVCNLCASKHRLNEVWDITADDPRKPVAVGYSGEFSDEGESPRVTGNMSVPSTAGKETPASPPPSAAGDAVAPTPLNPLNLMTAMDSEMDDAASSPLQAEAGPSPESSQPASTPVPVSVPPAPEEVPTPFPSNTPPVKEAGDSPEDIISPMSDLSGTVNSSDVSRTPGSAARRRSSLHVMARMANLSFDSQETGSTATTPAAPETGPGTGQARSVGAALGGSEGITVDDISSSSSESEEEEKVDGRAPPVGGKRPSRRGSWLQVLGLETTATAGGGMGGSAAGAELPQEPFDDDSEGAGGESSSSGGGEEEGDSASGSSIGDDDIKKYIRRTRKDRSGSREYDDDSSVSSRSVTMSVDQFVSPFGGQRLSSNSRIYRESSGNVYSSTDELDGDMRRIVSNAAAERQSPPAVAAATKEEAVQKAHDATAAVTQRPAEPARRGSLRWFFGMGAPPSRRSSAPMTVGREPGKGVPEGSSEQQSQKRASLNDVAANQQSTDPALPSAVVAEGGASGEHEEVTGSATKGGEGDRAAPVKVNSLAAVFGTEDTTGVGESMPEDN
jgi:hypothetical protein